MIRIRPQGIARSIVRDYSPLLGMHLPTTSSSSTIQISQNAVNYHKYNLQCTRSYVFFETGLGDFIHSLFHRERRKELYKRQQIMVKLRDTRKMIFSEIHDRTLEKRKRIVTSSKLKYDNAKSKIVEWRKLKQSRIQTFYDNKRSAWTNKLGRVSDQVKDRSVKMKNLAQSHGLYLRRPVIIDEPMHPDWFTPDGYPITSRNPYTGRFVNPWNSQTTSGLKSLADVWKWKSTRLFGFFAQERKLFEKKNQMESKVLHDEKVQSAFIPTLDHIKLTWIGHASCFLHMSNKFTILTDPVFSKKPSPIPFFEDMDFLGVPRLIPPSLKAGDFAPGSVDVCVISHDHYDHLDVRSIQALHSNNVVKIWAVPLGLKTWFHDLIDIEDQRVIEMKWWQRAIIQKDSDGTVSIQEKIQNILDHADMTTISGNSLEVTCAPCQHWGSRTPFDRNTRLWCSWGIKLLSTGSPKDENMGHSLNFYFAGDTGYSKTFPLHRQIGDKLGPFDLSAIPIGAYKPRFFMKDSHCDPNEAVQIHSDIRSKRSVAIHWGTFPLANEHFDEPPAYLEKSVDEANKKNVSEAIDFITIPHGESIHSSGTRINVDEKRSARVMETIVV